MNLISFFQAVSWYDMIDTFSIMGWAMQGTPVPELIGMGFIGLAILIAVVAIVYELLNRDEPFEIGVSERPLPNIFLGWILLWVMSAFLLTIYPFPTRAAMNPQRVTPPHMVAEAKSSEGSDEGILVSAEDALAVELLVNNGCGGCHTVQGVEGMAGVVGPDLSQVGASAAERLEDPAYTGSATTPEEYIHESIVESDLFVVANYPASVMPLTFGDTLSPEDLETMVNFLTSRQLVAEANTSPPTDEGTSEGAEDALGVKLLVNNGCGGCHTVQGVEGMAGVVGPDLSKVGASAAQRLEDPAYTGSATTPEEYIHESIVESDLFVVANYPASVMPLTFGDTLSPEDIETMVNFLTSRQ